jgi:hypothetical protein
MAPSRPLVERSDNFAIVAFRAAWTKGIIGLAAKFSAGEFNDSGGTCHGQAFLDWVVLGSGAPGGFVACG